MGAIQKKSYYKNGFTRKSGGSIFYDTENMFDSLLQNIRSGDKIRKTDVRFENEG